MKYRLSWREGNALTKIDLFIKGLDSITWKGFIKKYGTRIALGDRFHGTLILETDTHYIIEAPKVNGNMRDWHVIGIEKADIYKIVLYSQDGNRTETILEGGGQNEESN